MGGFTKLHGFFSLANFEVALCCLGVNWGDWAIAIGIDPAKSLKLAQKNRPYGLDKGGN